MIASQWIQTASHWGVYEVETRDGIARSARPIAWDADPSPIIQALPAVVQGPLRVSQPFVRRGYDVEVLVQVQFDREPRQRLCEGC